MKLKIIDSGNSENLSLVNKIGNKPEFTITRVHCITKISVLNTDT